MSHWAFAENWKASNWRKIPPNIKRCSSVVFEDKNVFRLNARSHNDHGRFGHPPARHCQQKRTTFPLAKGQPIMLPSLYVNPHTPCPKNYTGPLTDFIFIGSFANDPLLFPGCMLVNTLVCNLIFHFQCWSSINVRCFCPIWLRIHFNWPPSGRIRMCKWLSEWIYKDKSRTGNRSICAGRHHPSKNPCSVPDCK